MLSLFAGFLAGSTHVISGPDHLAALAPIALDSPKEATKIGIRWGIGHGLGVLLLGGLGVIARTWVDIHSVSAWSEFLVGFMLMFVGVWSFYRAQSIVIHTHPHEHVDEESDNDQQQHQHIHIHTRDTNNHSMMSHHGHMHTAFWVGMLHGAAGGGHLLGVLPSLAFTTFDAILYLSAYFIAAVMSMGIFAKVLGLLSFGRGPLLLQKLMYTVSLLVFSLGILWSYQTWPL